MFFLIPMIVIITLILIYHKIFQNNPSSKVGYVLFLIPISVFIIAIDVITNGMISNLLNFNFFETSFYLLLIPFLIITISIIISFISSLNLKDDNLKILKYLDIIANIITGLLIFYHFWSHTYDEMIDRIIIILIILIILSTISLYLSTTKNIENKVQEPKKKNSLIIPIITCFVIAILAIFIIHNEPISIRNLTLKEILEKVPVLPNNTYDSYDYYLIYHDKIYIYVIDNKNDNNIHTIYSMNLDGSHKKIFFQTEALYNTHFMFGYNNELYFHSHKTNYKINLDNSDLTSLKFEESIQNKTYQNDKVSMTDYSLKNNTFTTLKRYDLKNDKILNETTLDYNIISSKYIFNYETSDIYYLKVSDSTNQLALYKNDLIIYEFNENIEEDQIQIIACNEDYFYYKVDNTIFKLNVSSKTIEKTISSPTKIIKRIDSGNNQDNYYLGDNKIYELSFTTDTFNLVLENVNAVIDEVYPINNKLYFTQNANTIKKVGNYLSSVIIYDPEQKQAIKRYDDLIRITFDDQNMYLVKAKNDDYVINKIPLL